ncbi:MAG: hypothetical protein M1817_006701 [Caeruleum heppii]|nr:MAG: hypothetical protein M1817_006701 [Caeruleum heppii]
MADILRQALRPRDQNRDQDPRSRERREASVQTPQLQTASPSPPISKPTADRDLKSAGTETGGRDPAPEKKKRLPKGVVLGKDGKPCRSCTSVAAWAAMSRSSTSSQNTTTTTSATPSTASATSTPLPPSDCPPDVDTLGNHTWTLLHSLPAAYPPDPSPAQQSDMRSFLDLFARLYPCWVCAEDFQDWMKRRGNEPRVESQEVLGRWMCEAHNEVNRKLGKREFDCERWRERWKDGWKDGRCG